ncbi:helix-turn-helix domain-containing protein [Pseudaquabacterium pictum]|uniref:Helix-turn-helix domain-containing protein n=1 Tax=Pseudaquabacterium pictum TaxID=2315236 RepID=A0A480AIR0_9BURK|nr:helix-turn-helix domain-containing protein [Rubrivivax pictus]GCL61524.1 hypothetical protein AQPW35_06050 [Rubrivivax pictus]
MSTTVTVYTAEQVAQLLGCAVKTVEQMARDGELAGVKPGGGWVFPAGALAQRLDQLALEQAAGRRKTPAPVATTVHQVDKPRRGPKPRALPKLVPMGGQA